MDSGYCQINFQQAKQLLDAEEQTILVDVRTEEEYIVEHAAGAVLFPLDDIDQASAKRLLPDPETPVLLYCRTGRRSKLAAERLVNLGYRHVMDLGSLAGWPYGKDYGI